MSACNDANANALMHQLFQIPAYRRETQVVMVKALPSGVVSYVISRGFGLAIPSTGKRNKLIDLVLTRSAAEMAANADAMTEDERVAMAAEIAAENQARRNALAAVRAARAAQTVPASVIPADIMMMIDACIQTFQSFAYSPDMVVVLRGHSFYNEVQPTYLNPQLTLMNIVVKFLTTMFRLESSRSMGLPHSTRLTEINQRLQIKFNEPGWIEAALKSGARGCNIRILQAGIIHMVNMVRMYNYIRLIQADQFQFNYSLNHVGFVQPAAQPAQVPNPPQMKPLKIRIVVMTDLNEEDTDDETEEDDDHKCGVCFDNFTERKLVITGCNHSFCSTCIHGVARTRGLKSFILCPSCRTEVSELSVSLHDYQAVVAGIAPGPI